MAVDLATMLWVMTVASAVLALAVLLADADRALYAATRNGRNRVEVAV
jgi:PleD family two-component response regulator